MDKYFNIVIGFLLFIGHQGCEQEEEEWHHLPLPHVECVERGGARTDVLQPTPQGGEENYHAEKAGSVHRQNIFFLYP